MAKKLIIMILTISSISFLHAAKIYIDTGTTDIKIYCPYTIPVEIVHAPAEESTSTTVHIQIDTGVFKIGYTSNNLYNYFQESLSGGFVVNGSNYNVYPSSQNIMYSTPTRFAFMLSNNPPRHLAGTIEIGTIGIISRGIVTGGYIGTYIPGSVVSDSIGNNLSLTTGGGIFTFITGTCQSDNGLPYTSTFTPNLAANSSTTKVKAESGFSFWLYDNSNEYTGSQPGYTDDSLSLTTTGYTANKAGRNLGIATGTISFTLRGSGTNVSWNSSTPMIFTAGNITTLSGSIKTWDRFWRDYYINITGNTMPSYGIEKPMLLSGYFEDRDGNSGSFIRYFNNPINPRLSENSPADGATNILPLSDIQVRVSDDWAGIDSGSLQVSIYSGGCAGVQLGHIFSGAEINLSGIAGSADTPDYIITLHSGAMILPTPGVNICVIVSGQDNAMNQIISNSWNFWTRASCNTLEGCMEPLTINFLWNGNTSIFSLPILYVTGANSPYPYLQGNTLDCGPSTNFTGFLLTGNIMTGGRYTGYNTPQILNISGGRAEIVNNQLILHPS
ncbi:MAG: hypothetical protein NTX91_04995 [candidate division SR1 bacterium]|nr:hypothetical protein [candidate division SR1 bacterium]